VKRPLTALALAGLLSLAAAGCSSDSSMPGMDHGSDSTETTAAGADFNDADVTFAQAMIPHHEQAVEMAKLAEDRAESQEVLDLAAAIEAAQGPEIEQMTTWLEDWGRPMGDDMGSMSHDGMMTEDQMTDLEAAAGTEFDAMFLEMMIEHHEGAIEMAQEEVDKGQNPDAVALAENIIEAQKSEITTMQGLLEAS
jgi:uncharacterized protein (DUF305 family)